MQKSTSFLNRLNRAYAYAVLRAIAVSLLFSIPLVTRAVDQASAILYKIFIEPDYEKWDKTGEQVGLISPRIVPLKPNITEQQLLDFLAVDSRDKSSLAYYNSLVDLGNFYYQNGRIHDFTKTAHLALDVLVNRFSTNDWVQLLVLVPLAETYATQVEYQEALPLFRRALTLYTNAEGESTEHVAFIKHNIALSLKNLKQNDDEAEQHFQRSIAIIENLTPPRPNALPDFLDGYAIFLAERRHDYHRAYDTALRALRLTRALPNVTPKQIAERTQNVGRILVLQNRMTEALEYAKEVERLDSGVERTAEGSAGKLNDLALMYEGAGQLDKALVTAKEALEKMERATGQDSASTAQVLNTLAGIYNSLGLNEEALLTINRALKIQIAVFGSESVSVAETLVSRGAIKYKSDLAGAISDLEQSRKIFEMQRSPDELRLASVNLNLAISYLMQAYNVLASSNNPWMGVVASDLAAKADESAQISVNLRRKTLIPGDKDLRSSQLLLGLASLFKDDATKAKAAFQDSLEGSGSYPNDDYLTGLSELMLSITYAYSNQDDLSILWGKEAVNTLQRERGSSNLLHPALKANLESRARTCFEIVATLLVRQGRVAEAQEILQMLKEHELYESFRGQGDDPRKTRAELTGLEKSKFSRFYQLRDQQIELATKRRRFDAMLARGERITNSEEQKQYRDIVSRQSTIAEAMRQFIRQLETDLAATPSRVIQNSASVAAESSLLTKAVNELAVSEPSARAVGLQYFVGKDTLTAILTIPGAPPIAYQQRLDSVRFYSAIRTVSLQMQSPRADPALYEPALQDLYAILIEPVAADLKRADARTLMLSLDDHVRMLPFAALLDRNRRHLVQDYTLALYNEAAGQTLRTPGRTSFRVAAMGLSGAVDGRPALTSVPGELSGILKLPGVEGDAYLNQDFTRERLRTVLEQIDPRPYNVLHVASHFVLKPGLPDESFLYLGDGTRFSLAEIGREALNFSHFDLVTYSACQTAAAGGRDATGQEMESLSARTQRQGAQAVMATLWSVSDQSTGYFMRQYYAQRKAGLNKAEALRAVQIAMASGNGLDAGKTAWMLPHHWASFVVAGNWR